MNKIITTLLTFLCVPLFVHAQDATSTKTHSTTTSLISEAQVPEEGPRIQLSQAKQKRITNLVANISNALDARIARLENIAMRMERRAGKMESDGYDVTDARVKIAEAKATLSNSRLTMGAMDMHVKTMTTSEQPQQQWGKIRVEMKHTFTELKVAKKTLLEALVFLKTTSQKREEKPAATTTPILE